MQYLSKKGHSALRIGRLSIQGARYFITVVTKERAVGLIDCFDDLLRHGLKMDYEGAWDLHGLMVMPDHAHLALTTRNQNLSQCLQRWKGRCSPNLRSLGLRWQNAFHDHRLRTHEDWGPFFRYMLLNPYRSEHIDWSSTWKSCWWCADWHRQFLPSTHEGIPLKEWDINQDMPITTNLP